MSTNKDPEKVFKAIEKLNLQEIATAMFQTASAIINNQEYETETVQVELKVPKSVYDMVKQAGDKFGVDANQVFSKMASDGFEKYTKSALDMGFSTAKEETKTTEKPQSQENNTPNVEEFIKSDLFKQATQDAPNITNLMSNLSTITGFADQLKDMQKNLENVSKDLEPNKTNND